MENDLSGLGREIFGKLYQELCEWDEKIKTLDKRINLICQQNDDCQRLAKVAGIGPLTATALIAAIGDIHVFKNGRHLSAWLGLVPGQCSSGNKQVFLGISKRGAAFKFEVQHGLNFC